MCLRCEGLTETEVLDRLRLEIADRGWAVVTARGMSLADTFAYTVGLTRYHGHPELLVAGMARADVLGYLDGLARFVAEGVPFSPGGILAGPGRHRSQFVAVDDPEQLTYAQSMYASAGLVPALQVVYSSHDGGWPWEPGWVGCGGEEWQELYGEPGCR